MTFKEMTDAMPACQTERFTELLQRSTRYPGGLALRLARVVRYRDDTSAAEADTIDTVRALAEGS